MNNFYSNEELSKLGLGSYGENVLISKNAVLREPQKLNVGNNVRIDDFTTISGIVTLNNYIHIATFCGLYGGISGIVFEDFSTISSGCSVYAVSDDYTGYSMTNSMIPEKYKPTLINAEVTLKRHSIVGCNSVILPGVVIGEGTAVGSMSLCNKSTEAWCIYMGTPARKKRLRNKKVLELEKQLYEDSHL